MTLTNREMTLTSCASCPSDSATAVEWSEPTATSNNSSNKDTFFTGSFKLFIPEFTTILQNFTTVLFPVQTKSNKLLTYTTLLDPMCTNSFSQDVKLLPYSLLYLKHYDKWPKYEAIDLLDGLRVQLANQSS